MTALPKHWPSSRRQGKRRAAKKGPKLAQIVLCRHCKQPKAVGLICQNCKK